MKKLIILSVLAVMLLASCDFPSLPGTDGGVVFKVQLIQKGLTKAEKLLNVNEAKRWYQAGNTTDKWDTTWVAVDFSNHAKDFRLHFEVDDAGKFEYSLIDVVQINIHFSGGSTGWLNPAQCSDQFNNWQGSDDAMEGPDGCYAYVVNNQPTEQEYHDFGFAIPDGAVITGIEVRVNGRVDNKVIG